LGKHKFEIDQAFPLSLLIVYYSSSDLIFHITSAHKKFQCIYTEDFKLQI